MGTRETQRRAWREAVARAAEEWREAERIVYRRPGSPLPDACEVALANAARRRLDRFLSAPKPWTRPAKADLGRDTRRMRLLREDSITLLRLDGTVRGVWRSKAYFALCARLRRKRRAAQRRRR